MIAFEEMDSRLKAIGESRAWLAMVTPYSADYIRTVLAPNSTRRTARVQQILSDAIEREEESASITTMPESAVALPDRVTIECSPQERRSWENAASPHSLDDWIVSTLNDAASGSTHLKVAEDPTHYRTGNGSSGKP